MIQPTLTQLHQPFVSLALQPGQLSVQAPTVAIVSSDAALADSMAWRLEAMGFRARAWESVSDAMQAADGLAPRCLILELGVQHGWAYRQLQAIARLPSTTDVILVADPEDAPLWQAIPYLPAAMPIIDLSPVDNAMRACLEHFCAIPRAAANDALQTNSSWRSGQLAG